MSEFFDVINAFGNPLKLAWVGWVAWGVGQYFWFRHERSARLRPRTATAVAKPAVKKAAVPKPVAAQAADAPVVGRLITPTHVTANVKPAASATETVVKAPAAMQVAQAADAPTFDPSMAVIEQFGTNDGVLDKFVRDFEMQDARPRRRRTPPAETTSYGAEAPQTP